MSEKRKNEAKISLVKSSYRIFAAIIFVMLVCPLSFCLLIIFSSSEFYHSLDKGECARTFQQLTNEKYHFVIPNPSNAVITDENVSDLIELYRIRLEDHIVQADSDEFMPASIWLKSNDEAVLVDYSVRGIDSETFALSQDRGFNDMPLGFRICSTVNGSQIKFLSIKFATYSDYSYFASDRPHIILTSYTQQITNQYLMQFWDSSQETLLMQIPVTGSLYDFRFSDDKRTVCALSSDEFVCWGIPSAE